MDACEEPNPNEREDKGLMVLCGELAARGCELAQVTCEAPGEVLALIFDHRAMRLLGSTGATATDAIEKHLVKISDRL